MNMQETNLYLVVLAIVTVLALPAATGAANEDDEAVRVVLPVPDSDAACPWTMMAFRHGSLVKEVEIPCDAKRQKIVLWLLPGNHEIRWQDADGNVFRVDSVTPFAPKKPQI